METAEVIVAGGGILSLSIALELALRLPGLYPEYLSTVEALSGRSVHLRTQAAINTDVGNRTRVAMSGAPPPAGLEAFAPGRPSK